MGSNVFSRGRHGKNKPNKKQRAIRRARRAAEEQARQAEIKRRIEKIDANLPYLPLKNNRKILLLENRKSKPGLFVRQGHDGKIITGGKKDV